MHKKNIITAGVALNEATGVLIMLHGRGAGAEDILALSAYLSVKEYALLAPQAANGSWYPYSFMAPPAQNEPWLSSALTLIKDIVSDLVDRGIPSEKIYFTGFSQGACLTLEFVARNAAKYGGVAAFTGGLIGDNIYSANYKGDFKGTPVFIGTGDPDPHVPAARVHATANILRILNASVTEKVYANIGHTVTADEITQANRLIFTQHTDAHKNESNK